jgi:hypothetical protein
VGKHGGQFCKRSYNPVIEQGKELDGKRLHMIGVHNTKEILVDILALTQTVKNLLLPKLSTVSWDLDSNE